MYRANLSYGILIKYLTRMSRAGLVQKTADSNGYCLTEDGRDFLKLYSEYEVIRKRIGKVAAAMNDDKAKLKITLDKSSNLKNKKSD